MRSFLLWCGSMVVGMATILGVVSVLESGTAVLAPFAVLWLVSVLIGVVLSAPFVLAPPNTTLSWSMSLPVTLWLVLLVLRLISGTGLLVLRGVWFLLALVIHRQVNQPGSGRTGSTPPSGQATPTGTVPGSPAASTRRYPPPVGLRGSLAAPAASWQPDPTGRFQQRYWDGMSWTANVANGSVFAVDPI